MTIVRKQDKKTQDRNVKKGLKICQFCQKRASFLRNNLFDVGENEY